MAGNVEFKKRNSSGERDGGQGALQLRVPPHDYHAEAALIASCILDNHQEVLNLALNKRLRPDAFYDPRHGIIFNEILQLYEKAKPIDELIIADGLRSKTIRSIPGRERDPDDGQNLLEKVGGHAFLNQLTSVIETTVHAQHWMDIVHEKWQLRRLLGVCTNVAESIYSQTDKVDTFLEDVEQKVFAISQDRVTTHAQPISKSVEEASAMIQKILQGGVSQGVLSGYNDLDKMTFGLHPAEMVVLAARPSMGKTSFALNIAENASLPNGGAEGVNTLVFSLEMSSDQLAMRMLCGRARVNLKRVRDRMVSGEDQRSLISAAREIKSAPIWIDDAGHVTILELRAKARRVHAQHGLQLVVVDYLQLIHGTDSRVPREQQISEISRGIKAMAKELNVPVIVLSQLNRDSEKEKRRPRLSDLRESGSIEQDADVVLLLANASQSENDDGEIPQAANARELIIAKNRNGPVGSINLTFIPEFTRFENYTPNREL